MKFQIYLEQIGCHMSPSMRREWIEISVLSTQCQLRKSPSMRREWIEISMRLTVIR